VLTSPALHLTEGTDQSSLFPFLTSTATIFPSKAAVRKDSAVEECHPYTSSKCDLILKMPIPASEGAEGLHTPEPALFQTSQQTTLAMVQPSTVSHFETNPPLEGGPAKQFDPNEFFNNPLVRNSPLVPDSTMSGFDDLLKLLDEGLPHPTEEQGGAEAAFINYDFVDAKLQAPDESFEVADSATVNNTTLGDSTLYHKEGKDILEETCQATLGEYITISPEQLNMLLTPSQTVTNDNAAIFDFIQHSAPKDPADVKPDFAANSTTDFALASTSNAISCTSGRKRKAPAHFDDSDAGSVTGSLSGPTSRRSVHPKDPEYREKRDRNNEAVRKSRGKAKEKQRATEDENERLKKENESMSRRIEVLEGQVKFMKELMTLAGFKMPKN
jgi:hypothetical protein